MPVSTGPGGIQQVPQKTGSLSGAACGVREVIVKMWGKSPRLPAVMRDAGKPQELKGQINRELRAARPIPVGRLIDRTSDGSAR